MNFGSTPSPKIDISNTAFTIAMIARATAYNGSGDTPFCQSHGNTPDMGIYWSNTGWGLTQGGTSWSGGNSLSTGIWAFYGISCQAYVDGNQLQKYHQIDLGAFTNAASEPKWNAGGAGAPTASTATRVAMGCYSHFGGAPAGADIVVAAMWNSSLQYANYSGTSTGNGNDQWAWDLASGLYRWRDYAPTCLFYMDMDALTVRPFDDVGTGTKYTLYGAGASIGTDTAPVGYGQAVTINTHSAAAVAARRRVHVT